jgi:hypothetical protein
MSTAIACLPNSRSTNLDVRFENSAKDASVEITYRGSKNWRHQLTKNGPNPVLTVARQPDKDDYITTVSNGERARHPLSKYAGQPLSGLQLSLGNPVTNATNKTTSSSLLRTFEIPYNFSPSSSSKETSSIETFCLPYITGDNKTILTPVKLIHNYRTGVERIPPIQKNPEVPPHKVSIGPLNALGFKLSVEMPTGPSFNNHPHLSITIDNDKNTFFWRYRPYSNNQSGDLSKVNLPDNPRLRISYSAFNTIFFFSELLNTQYPTEIPRTLSDVREVIVFFTRDQDTNELNRRVTFCFEKNIPYLSKPPLNPGDLQRKVFSNITDIKRLHGKKKTVKASHVNTQKFTSSYNSSPPHKKRPASEYAEPGSDASPVSISRISGPDSNEPSIDRTNLQSRLEPTFTIDSPEFNDKLDEFLDGPAPENTTSAVFLALPETSFDFNLFDEPE